MLVYHPAFDLYNCMFRMLLILENTKHEKVELERLLIWDFYVTFPYKVTCFEFTRDSVTYRKLFSKITINPYDIVDNEQTLFTRMRSYQMTALRNLVSYGLIDSDALAKSMVIRTETKIPENITSQFEKVPQVIRNVIELVSSPFNELPLYGHKGFKYRTKLIDFKYDAE